MDSYLVGVTPKKFSEVCNRSPKYSMEFKSGEQGTNGVSGSVLEPFLMSSVHNAGVVG